MKQQISIIVPIYNVEDYLEECIESVIEQENFDLINVLLIDDGSMDGSSIIAKRFADKYENIFYHYKQNGGLSSARNFGMNLVDTNYVMFLDSDDKLTPTAASSLYTLALKSECPIVIGNLVTFPAKTPNYLWKKYFENGDLIVNNIYDFPDLIFGPSACNKIFKVEYLKSNNFSFPEGLTFEDAYAIIPLMLDNRPIAILDEVVYLYRKRNEKGSIMDSLYTRKKNYFDHLLVNERLFSLIPEDATLQQKEMIFKYILRTYNGFLVAMQRKENDIFSNEEKSEIFNRLHSIYKQIPLYMFQIYSENLTMKLIYYSLLENQVDLFLVPVLSSDFLRVNGNNFSLPLERTKVSSDYLNCPWSIWIDYLEVEQDHLTLYGVMETTNIAFHSYLKNDITFFLEDPKTKKVYESFPSKIINRADYQKQENAAYHGIKCSIPLETLKAIPTSRNNQLKVRIHDTNTQEMAIRKVNAFGLLNRFKGEIKDSKGNKAGFLNIYNQRGIYFRRPEVSLKRRFITEVKRIIDRPKKRLKVGAKMRILYWLSYPFLSRKNIVLVGERRDTFQDNSAHLFKYVRSKYPNENWFYLIDKKSSQYQEVKKLGNVIPLNTIKHYLYLLNAKKLVNSYDIESYMIPKGYSKGEFLNKFGDLINYRRIFLQHGIVYNDISLAASRYKTANDLIVSSNTQETNFFIEKAHFKEDQILRTGIPRYDRLSKYIRQDPLKDGEQRQILLMPTWRSTLAKKSYVKKSKQRGANENHFMESDYYKFYNGLLTDTKVTKFLSENNAVLNFCPHYEMKDFVHLFKTKSKHINIIIPDKNVLVQDLLIQSDVLITDYSSVFFDFSFMKKPIIFTQFDYEEFFKTQYKEGYLSFANQKIGPVVKNNSEVIKALEEIDANQYMLTNEQENYSKQFFDYYDGSSISEKIYQKIKEL